MTRPGPRRVPISVKVNPADLPRIDQLAAANGLNRSEWVRATLEEALHKGKLLAGSRPRTDQPPVVAEPYLEAP